MRLSYVLCLALSYVLCLVLITIVGQVIGRVLRGWLCAKLLILAPFSFPSAPSSPSPSPLPLYSLTLFYLLPSTILFSSS
jgi:hypothetical protein